MLKLNVLVALLFATFTSAIAISARSSWKSVPVSRTLFISRKPYYIPAEPLVELKSARFDLGHLDVLPVVALSAKDLKDLDSTVEKWLKSDDVFDKAFFQGALLQINSGKLPSNAVKCLHAKGTSTLLFSGGKAPSAPGFARSAIGSLDIPPGPYVIARSPGGGIAVYTPYRLFYDDTQSFYKSVTPSKDGSFAVVSASLDTDSSPYIGVPSRVYASNADKSKTPLSGVRVTVKDIYHLKGLRTSAGNRHFYATYGPRNATAPSVKRLASLGANIIGVTKTVQFANGDRPTADWVDYHASFNPRADGYRDPSGSSTGAGSSVSALEFVDVAIGSDTGGSIRGPASANGLYGIRPSVGAITLEDVVPLSDVLDTGGYLTRDPKLFATFGKSWYKESFKSYPSLPSKILLADEFAAVTEPAAPLFTEFLGSLSKFLNASVANYSVGAEWNKTSGMDVPITTWLNSTYPTLVAVQQWNAVGAKFFADYAATNGGRNPHINPAVLNRWRYGQAQGQEGLDAALLQRSTFENWTLNNFLLENDKSCSDAIYLYPQGTGATGSRETYFLGPSSPPFGFSNGRIAVHARTPDIVIPIKHTSQLLGYTCIDDGITEQLPVSVSVVARRGCDFMLLDLVDKLADAGIVKTVKTGRTAF